MRRKLREAGPKHLIIFRFRAELRSRMEFTMKYLRATIMAIGASLIAMGSGFPTKVQASSKALLWWPLQSNSRDESGEEKRLEELKEFLEEREQSY